MGTALELELPDDGRFMAVAEGAALRLTCASAAAACRSVRSFLQVRHTAPLPLYACPLLAAAGSDQAGAACRPAAGCRRRGGRG
jgi:hypothetical protein